jgi:hypothetical protein
VPAAAVGVCGCEDLQETRVDAFLLLVYVTAFEEKGFGVKVGEAAIIGVMSHVGEAFAGNHHGRHFQLWAFAFRIGESLLEFGHFRILGSEPVECGCVFRGIGLGLSVAE